LTAVNNTFLVALEHEELGHIATPQAMLVHLKEEYGELDATEIKTNRATLAGAWNPDDHIEDLFTCIHDVQRLATKANEPITDGAAVCLTIMALENTGVFERALELWRLKPEADKTMDNFKKHFRIKNKARLAKLTAQTAGYHGAHAASSVSPSVTGTSTPPAPRPVTNAVAAMTPSVLTDDSVHLLTSIIHIKA
jgi:hypothetical protein